MTENNLTFTSVYYEKTFGDAQARLAWLRKKDRKYPEVKGYIIRVKNEFRVLRRVKVRI